MLPMETDFVGCGRECCAPNKEPVMAIPGYYMIHFVESGKGVFDGQLVSAGQGFVCQKDTLCRYYPDAADPWAYMWINVSGPGADDLVARLPMRDNRFEWDLYGSAAPLRKLCETEPNTPGLDWAAVGTLYTVAAAILSRRRDLRRDYTAEARRLFENGYEHGITVTEVAEKLHLSRAYLRNVFYRDTGMSPQAYLMNLRMERAAQLLAYPYRIGEIAAAIGYEDALQFSKMFTRFYGVSPRDYRAKKGK